jgi:hypothetical protein
VESFLTEQRSQEMKYAILKAGSGAESFKALGGDARETAYFLSGIRDDTANDAAAAVFYDENWNPCPEDQASFVMTIIRTADSSPLLILSEITVSRTTDGEELFALPVAVRGSVS